MHALRTIPAPVLVILGLLWSCFVGWSPPAVDLGSASPSTRSRVDSALEAASSGDTSAVLALGDLYFALGYPGAAGDCYQRAAASSQNAEDWFLAAVSALDVGDSLLARELLQVALELEPQNQGALLALADLDLESGDLEAARAGYETTLQNANGDPRAVLGLARIALASGEAQEAVERFRQVLELRPNADRIRVGLAEAYRLLGRPDLARLERQRAGPGEVMSNDPALARVGRVRIDVVGETVVALAEGDETSTAEVAGFAVAQLGSVPGGARLLADRVQQVGAEASALQRMWFAVGALADRQGRPEEAVAAYEQGLAQVPSDKETQVRLGRALSRAGRLQEAEAALAASGSQEVDVLRDRGLLLRQLGRPAEAAALLTSTIERAHDSERDSVRLDLAEVRTAQGRVADAMSLYRVLADVDDPLIAATAWARLGSMAADRGDEEQAIEAFRRASGLEPAWLAPRFALAAALGRVGRFTDAEDEYREILTKHPGEEQAWLGAATAASLRGDSAAARGLLVEALEALPDSKALQAAVEQSGTVNAE